MLKIVQFGILSFLVFSDIHGLELPLQPYQDVFVNGSILAKGNGPDCAARYEAIRQVLDLYKRPITILDIGAAEGYFSFRASYDYDACAVMISDPTWNDNILEKLCIANTELDHVVLLSKKITPNELAILAECEHFDVVLAMNVIHHFGTQWIKAYRAILELGDQILIETPQSNDRGACGQPFLKPINRALNKEPCIVLGEFQRHTDPSRLDRLVWISRKRNDLHRKAFIFNPSQSLHTFEIASSFEEKSIKKFYHGRFVMEKKWIPGINLITFKSLNGTYPSKEGLVDALNEIISIPSMDWFPHNVILSGRRLHLIDTDDPYNIGKDAWPFSERQHRLMLKTIFADSQGEILELYKKIYSGDSL